jgi:hypothetical protein
MQLNMVLLFRAMSIYFIAEITTKTLLEVVNKLEYKKI